jgi:hypothetical protein
LLNDDFDFEFEKRFGIPVNHARVFGQRWLVTRWPKIFDEVMGKITYGKNGNFIDKLEKLWHEVLTDFANHKNTTIKPIQYAIPFNILLTVGLTASAQRDTNENTDTGISHIGVGTGGTAELESQTGLITAFGSRKSFDTSGQRKVVGQTAKYGMTFTDVDLTVPVTLKEAVTYNAVTGGTAHTRVQHPDFALLAGERISYQINELMANQT